MLRPAMTFIVACAVLALGAWSAGDAGAQATPSPPVEGNVPAEGGTGTLTLTAEMSLQALLETLNQRGCDLELLTAVSGAELRIYHPDAPAFVNGRFPQRLSAGTSVVVRCKPPRPDFPDLHLLPIVTKECGLPSTYAPDSLTPLPAEQVVPGGGPAHLAAEAVESLEQMLNAASAAGHDLRVRSAFRSYEEQVATHEYWVRVLGADEALRRSAPPGHSEHQLGTAVDLTSASVGWRLEQELGATPEGRWLSQHAWRFGFVESYPQGAEATTGYRYEPWHLRFVGRTHAEWLRLSGLTLTEYLDAVWRELGGTGACPADPSVALDG